MDKIIDYIRALVHLYGLVHKDKVVEIYNMQNDDQIDDKTFQSIIEDKRQYLLDEYYVYIEKDYFVSIDIMVLDTFDTELKAKKGKPYYIPEREELLKYRDPTYLRIREASGIFKKDVLAKIKS